MAFALINASVLYLVVKFKSFAVSAFTKLITGSLNHSQLSLRVPDKHYVINEWCFAVVLFRPSTLKLDLGSLQVAAAATPTAVGSGAASHPGPTVATINMATMPTVSQATVVKTATLATVDPTQQQGVQKIATISQSLVAQPLQIASSALPQQVTQGQTVVAAGTQHRVLSATPATAVVVSTISSTALAQGQPSITTVVQQQHQPIVTAPVVVSAQSAPSPSIMATVVTQTQPAQTSQAQQPASQLTAQQQQQLQKASPYAMRTRNPPKHS